MDNSHSNRPRAGTPRADSPNPEQDLLHWLALHRALGASPRVGAALLNRYGTPRAVISAACHGRLDSARGPRARALLRTPDWGAVERDLAWLGGAGRHLVTMRSPHYPAALEAIADPPLVLFVEGEPALLGAPQLAVVGSRNPSASGCQTALALAGALSRAGLVITSGLATGIDGAAHRGALSADAPTVAVSGTGLNRVYPRRHAELARDIARRGALVSEFLPDTPPRKANFPRRNRLISGLCHGVLVVEATIRSGSLITARMAGEQGREVFAVPGSIHSPLSRGCHKLLREGAALVETVEDVLAELAHVPGLRAGYAGAEPASPSFNLPTDHALEADEIRVLEHMGDATTSVDQLVSGCGLTAEMVSSILLSLELRGLVSTTPGGTYARTLSR